MNLKFLPFNYAKPNKNLGFNNYVITLCSVLRSRKGASINNRKKPRFPPPEPFTEGMEFFYYATISGSAVSAT